MCAFHSKLSSSVFFILIFALGIGVFTGCDDKEQKLHDQYLSEPSFRKDLYMCIANESDLTSGLKKCEKETEIKLAANPQACTIGLRNLLIQYKTAQVLQDLYMDMHSKLTGEGESDFPIIPSAKVKLGESVEFFEIQYARTTVNYKAMEEKFKELNIANKDVIVGEVVIAVATVPLSFIKVSGSVIKQLGTVSDIYSLVGGIFDASEGKKKVKGTKRASPLSVDKFKCLQKDDLKSEVQPNIKREVEAFNENEKLAFYLTQHTFDARRTVYSEMHKYWDEWHDIYFKQFNSKKYALAPSALQDALERVNPFGGKRTVEVRAEAVAALSEMHAREKENIAWNNGIGALKEARYSIGMRMIQTERNIILMDKLLLEKLQFQGLYEPEE